jgi:O-antigen ligase
LRILSWNASFEVIKRSLPFGVGEGQKEQELVNVYKEKQYAVPAELMHNSHNQYLDFLIGGGLIGFCLFMTGLIHLLLRSIKNLNYPLQAILFIVCFNALFENVLSRHAGILLFTVFISLLTSPKSQNQNNTVAMIKN